MNKSLVEIKSTVANANLFSSTEKKALGVFSSLPGLPFSLARPELTNADKVS